MPDKMARRRSPCSKPTAPRSSSRPPPSPRESPESYYSVADRLTREMPGAFQPNQYFNPANPAPTTRPPAPRSGGRLGGKIDVLRRRASARAAPSPASASYLKEQNPHIQVVGADPEGSIYTGDAPRPYKVEGIGEDFCPAPSTATWWTSG